MAMKTEEYAQDTIKQVTFDRLFQEYRERFSVGQEIEHKLNTAYHDGDVKLALAYASELGVIQIQIQILQSEVERRDREEGPMSEAERESAEAALLEAMIESLFK